MSVIKIENLCKNYKTKQALKDVSLLVEEGEIFGLLGVNGAGKTTMIKILCGLSPKTSGKVEVNGFDVDKDPDKIKQTTDISPQETSVTNNLSVKENLEFFANIYGKNNVEK